MLVGGAAVFYRTVTVAWCVGWCVVERVASVSRVEPVWLVVCSAGGRGGGECGYDGGSARRLTVELLL